MADTKKMIHDAFGIQKMQPNGMGGDAQSAHNYAIAKGVWAGKVMEAVEKQLEAIRRRYAQRPTALRLGCVYHGEWMINCLRTFVRMALQLCLHSSLGVLRDRQTQ